MPLSRKIFKNFKLLISDSYDELKFLLQFSVKPVCAGGRWCFCCFIQISRPLFIERRTFARPIPRYLATSAALCPVSSTAKYATNALASAIFFCLLPEHINSGLRSNFPATAAISSSMDRLGRYFFSSIRSDCSSVVLTKSPLPKILASPFSRSSLFNPNNTALSPPLLRINPPPCRSSRLPCFIPFFIKGFQIFDQSCS